MSHQHWATAEDDTNPHIALADLAVNLVLVLAFFIVLGRAGLENVAYRRAQSDFEDAVRKLPVKVKPVVHRGKNDPPGVQRWVFSGRQLFRQNTEEPELNPDGQAGLSAFSALLGRREHRDRWRRVRVEGHTLPPLPGQRDNWKLSSRRAEVVALQIQRRGLIEPYFVTVSGRAGQDPLHKVMVYYQPGDPVYGKVKWFLLENGITFSPKRIPRNGEAIAELQRLSGGATPATVVDDHVIVGYDPLRLKALGRVFPQNERVEILLEYVQKAGGRAEGDAVDASRRSEGPTPRR